MREVYESRTDGEVARTRGRFADRAVASTSPIPRHRTIMVDQDTKEWIVSELTPEMLELEEPDFYDCG